MGLRLVAIFFIFIKKFPLLKNYFHEIGFPGTTILMFSVYWTFGGIYTFLDVTNKPSFLRRYKIQPGTNEPVDSGRLIQVNKSEYNKNDMKRKAFKV